MASVRDVFKIGDADNGVDELEVVSDLHGITISIEEPWAGDTESGFGCTCSFRLDLKAAAALGHWLLDRAGLSGQR